MPSQSTDAANSAPLITATKPGDDLKLISSRSVRDIAGDDGASTGAKGSNDPVTAPVAGNA